MKKKRKYNRIGKRILSVVLSFALLISVLYMPEMDGWFGDTLKDLRYTVKAASPSISKNYPIGSLKEFYEFSKNYATDPDFAEENKNANIQITTNDTFELENEHEFTYKNDSNETITEFLDYYPIGTVAAPFGGKITISQASSSYFSIYSQMPIFDYIYDSVDIVSTNGSVQQLAINRTGNFADMPLFANNVVHDTRTGATSSTWDVLAGVAIANADTGETEAYNYSGIVGTIADNSVVNLIFTNNSKGSDDSYSDITGTSVNLGILAGTLGTGATLNAYIINGTNNEWKVETSGGNAGAYIGEMGSGSALNISADSSYNLSRAINVKSTADGSFAGGLVGKNDNGSVSLSQDDGTGVQAVAVFTSSGTITANKGAGGVFGYLRTTTNADYSSIYVINGAKVNAQNAGGIAGELVAEGADITIAGTTVKDGNDQDVNVPVNISVTLTSGQTVKNFGGIAGLFTNKGVALGNTSSFDITSITLIADDQSAPSFDDTSYCGGIFGSIDSSQNAAYIKTDKLVVSTTRINAASNCLFGGIIGGAGTKGSFINTGDIEVSMSGNDYLGGGLVGEMLSGVLRISGITNLTGAPVNTAAATAADKRGQIVGIRKDALVYALGTGSDATASYENGWRLLRSTVDSRADDIGTWGEVVRPDGTNITASALETKSGSGNAILYFDESAHTVTLSDAELAIDSVDDFVRTALNIQFNSGITNAALAFNDASNTSSVLLANALTISGEINLAGTGITGFMRDGYYSNVSEIGSFTGSLTGSNSACVKLAIGERYGVPNTTEGRGAIYMHRYNGLFAISGTGAKLSSVAIDGYINFNGISGDKDNRVFVGGAVALVNDGVELKSVDSAERINYCRIGGSFHYIGGLVGAVGNNSNADVVIEKASGAQTNVSIAPTIIVTGSLNDSGDSESNEIGHSIGGAIGFVWSKNTFETKITDVTLSAEIDASGTTNSPKYASTAGLIADFSYVGDGANDDKHNVTLKNITVSGTVVKNKASESSGGILGYRWNNTVADFENISFSSRTSGDNTIHNTLTTTAKYVGGLFYRATGYWGLNSGAITVNSLNITNAPTSSLGVLIHDAYYGSKTGLYLELNTTDSYTLNTGLGIPTVTGSTVYDELAAYTCSNNEILNNGGGKGVISIYTPAQGTVAAGVFSMDETNCNSYQNKYNKTVLNSHSRYYYNVSTMRTSLANDIKNSTTNTSDGEKLLLWSLNKYASTNIKKYFTDSYKSGNTTTISGNFDMVNISWYPINLSDAITLGDCTFKFYNSQINATEAVTDNGNTDANARTTLSGSQHYMMHYGLFRNVSSTITTTGNIRFKGNAGNDSTYTGVLINGTLSGTVNSSTSKEIVLEGITQTTKTGYLLINSITSNATLRLYGVRLGEGNTEETYTSAQVTDGVASSLIGNVSGTYITLDFGKLKLDGRNSAGDADSALSGLDTVYGTTRSIFTNAILLNKFDTNSTSDATYNFNLSEDWTNASTHPGKVAYGKEITDSVEYTGKEKKYFDPRYYVSPLAMATSSSAEYAFSSNFLPYVKFYNSSVEGAPTPTYQLREIKVNVIEENVNVGCGTYNHPYVITTAGQFTSVANMISGSGYIPVLRLPKTKGTASNNYNNHWCGNNKDDCAEFTSSGGNYTSTSTNTTYTQAEVREYLAGAYYTINQGFEISSTDSFPGLGSSTDSKYAFRGVVKGRTKDVTITINNTAPLVKISNGCVIKDLTVSIGATSPVVSGNNVSISTEYGYGDNNLYYGGLIGMIKGGDNVIDNVTMTYANTLAVGSTNHYLYNIGGYVGVVVNGGLMFRGTNTLSGYKVTNNDYQAESDTKHLFINPYVGRVINGYAIYENATKDEDTETYSGNYSGDTKEYTLNNTNKNYQISGVFMYPTNKLSYDTFYGGNRVLIPDGQSLFILSLITQSGAGTALTANGDYQYAVSYYGSNKYNNTAAVNEYAATHLCSYDFIGTDFDGDNAPSDKAKLAKESTRSKTAVPYIIYNYTKASEGSYPARMMTGNTSFMKLTTAGGTYNLPLGFRGIGSLAVAKNAQSTDNEYMMHIYGFDGNGATINENIEFKSYANNADNYANKLYGGNNVNLGMGLFNVLIQKAKDDIKTTYNLSDGYFIGNFTLTGKVEIKEYDGNSTSPVKGNFSNDNNSNNRDRYAAGGLTAGILPFGYVNVYNLDLTSIQITGTSFVGGYIGRNNIIEKDAASGDGASTLFFNGCDTTNTVVNGSTGCCGGIVGGSISGYPSIYVNTASIKDGDTHIKGTDNCYKSTMELSMTNTSDIKQSGIGGIIGTLRNGYQVELWINNVTIKGCGGNKGFTNDSTTPNNKKQWYQGAGGLFGFVRKADSIVVTNCNIVNLNIKAPMAGGLFGNIDFYDSSGAYGTSPVIKMANCKIFSDDNDLNYSIEGILGAGGISGQFTSSKAYDKTVVGYDGNNYNYDVNGCEVYSYIISQTSSTYENCGAGGLFGYARATSGKMRTIVNTSVHDCTIKVDGTKTSHGMGAIIGFVPVAGTDNNGDSIIIDGSNTKTNTKSYCGDVGAYNIVSYNNSFAYNGSETNAKCGNFVGESNGQNFKIVAFSRNNNTLNGVAVSKDYGTTISTSSYIVCSDYKNACLTNNAGKKLSDIKFIDVGMSDVDGGIMEDFFPYANVNPVTKMGVKKGENEGDEDKIIILTSDGSKINISNSASVSVAADIVGDITSSRGSYYQEFTSGANTIVNNMFVDDSDANYNEDIRLSTYDDEMGLPDESVDNFPVIALGGATNNANYTSFIQAYIRLVTNTKKNYIEDETGIYKIKVYPCRYIDGYYQKVDGVTQGLRLTGGQYKMTENLADSTKDNNQISLIEVQFLNPMNANEIAYHLYIPVLTKKMVKYNFASGALLGTEYEPSNYPLSSDSVFAGNFDNWFTSYVRYEYPQSEMQAILNSGKGLNWNSNKTINFQYFIKQDVANSTQFVLLDNNNNVDKVYYLNKNEIDTSFRQGGYPVDGVTLSSFKNPSGNPFELQTLNELAGKSVTYTSSNAGIYVELTGADIENATVYAYDSNGDNIKYFKAYETDDVGARYDLTANGSVTETYYLSTYTYKTDNVFSEAENTNYAYAFKVTCPKTLVGQVTMQKNTEQCATVFLGNIFEQTLNITQESPSDNKVISTSNNEISVTAMSTIKFVDSDDKEYFHTQLHANNLSLNQAFLIYLNKFDFDGKGLSDNRIKGRPSYSYTVSSTGGSSNITESSTLDEDELFLFTNPISISIPAFDEDNPNWVSTQTAVAAFTFNGSENELANEFEPRSRDESLAGTDFYVESKFDYVSDNVIYSSNIKDAKGQNRYYMQREEALKLRLTAMDQETDDAYDKYGEQSKNRSSLGINAKYVEEMTGAEIEHIDAGANLDASNLPDTFLKGITKQEESYTLKLTVKLAQKQNGENNSYTYVDVPIDTYLNDFKLTKQGVEIEPTRKEMINNSTWISGNGDKYVYEFDLKGDPSTWGILFTQGDDFKQFDCGMSFDVLTGDNLEAITGYRYANYRIYMTADLYKTSNPSERYDQVSDVLVYTNAKVNAQFVSPVTQEGGD